MYYFWALVSNMKISYNWLREFLSSDPGPQKTAEILTASGLEVEGLEHIPGMKSRLKGVVIGEVLEVWKHPGADRLRLTRVNIGGTEPLQIVCGAPNVAAGQKVAVATEGTLLYPVSGEPLRISKGKIRGEVSMGMICAEDELGLGESHEGIMVLDPALLPGRAFSELVSGEDDWVLEIGLTPNRADAFSHFGVARDLVAALRNAGGNGNTAVSLVRPEYKAPQTSTSSAIPAVEVRNPEACPRYCGILLENITIGPSPEWLQQRLQNIGLKPINNAVDITNYVQHELGQPLHAFDADKIGGGKIVVRFLPEGTPFVTLDGTSRLLSEDDLMICDDTKGLCIAGVFGGADSGVTEDTQRIFLESATFNPVHVRKTVRRHGLHTDAGFRFERGTDPAMPVPALYRAVALFEQLCGARVASGIYDSAPETPVSWDVDFNTGRCNSLLGLSIPEQSMEAILRDLDIEILGKNDSHWKLRVPAYRVDVKREADIAEEILRIYGYDHIPVPSALRCSLSYQSKPEREKLRHALADQLCSRGFYEIVTNSLTRTAYDELLQALPETEEAVYIANPLSSDLGMMRTCLAGGALETVLRNLNFRQGDQRLFEFGKAYSSVKENGSFREEEMLSIVLTGSYAPENWNATGREVSISDLTAEIQGVLNKLRIGGRLEYSEGSSNLYERELMLTIGSVALGTAGVVSSAVLEAFDIKQPVYYAELNMRALESLLPSVALKYAEASKFPSVRRDLSLLLDTAVKYGDLEKAAYRAEPRLLKEVGLFDVYEGDKLPQGKKSYALRFVLQDSEKTLSDERIDKSMSRILEAFVRELKVELRS